MPYTRCLVIPAVKKNAVIPDQLLKRLAGKTLIQRALDTALALLPPEHIFVVTDSNEIRLICERNQVSALYNPHFIISSLDIVASLRSALEELATLYDHLIIYRASSPLITAQDIEDAYTRFTSKQSDCLVTVKNIRYRLWESKGQSIDALLFNEEAQTVYVETKALFMLKSHVLNADTDKQLLQTTPYFLNDRSIEINSYQDWWICEKLLQRKHIVFVVAGYAAIGMGHIYRALMLAHEIADHRITFLCTKESELAATNIAARDYRTKVQQSRNLADDVLALRPDLVINDILNTSPAYMSRLVDAKVPTVNFEDEGTGATLAHLVVNALYEKKGNYLHGRLYGYHFFCLRDEFVHARQNHFRDPARKLLITFGGTDHSDYTRLTLNALFPLCCEHKIAIEIVTGPGYAHKEELNKHITALSQKTKTVPITFNHATNIMSAKMEDVDLAVSSAGRTVYELAHMRIPSIVIPHHAREDMHTFARQENGFTYLGLMQPFDAAKVQHAFIQLLDASNRKKQYDRLCRFDFTQNKKLVVDKLLSLINTGKTS